MFFSLDTDSRYQKPQNKARVIGLGVFLVASLGVAAFGVTRAATTLSVSQDEKMYSEKKETAQEAIAASPVVTKEDHARGVGELQNVLIEYSDFQCPVCAPYASMLHTVEREFRGKLTIVYRHFPKDIIHKNAYLAAQAAQAAGEQGKFWQMHDLLYEKQAEWSIHENPQNLILHYVKALLLDTNKFTEDMNSRVVDEGIQKDIQSGKKSLVDTTPTFFLNGKKIASPHTIEEFKKVIKEELKIK